MDSSQYSIWKRNNTNIIQTIDNIMNVSRNCVYSLLYINAKKVTEENNQNDVKNDRNSQFSSQ